MQDHYNRLENMYHNHPMNRFIKARISISECQARVSIEVRPEFFHAAGATHGAIYFKALDDAAFFAVNSVVPDVFVLTTSFNTYLTRPISDGSLIAEGKLVYHNKSQYIGEAILFNQNKVEIGRGSGMYIRSKIKLQPEMGYNA